MESIPTLPNCFYFNCDQQRWGREEEWGGEEGGGAAAAALPGSCLAGGRHRVQQARQIYGAGGDLWGRNTVMGEWLSTVSYWHLTKCPKQNEFTSLFLNHQAATALTPILTAITRSPISQGPEKFTVTSTFQWAQVSTSFTFSDAGAAAAKGLTVARRGACMCACARWKFGCTCSFWLNCKRRRP